MTFDYENSRWAGGNKMQARLWYDELERLPPFLVRDTLGRSGVGPASTVRIGTVSMPKGFAEDWLTHLEKRVQTQLRAGKGILKVAREIGVGTGTVQRIKQEMTGPFAVAAA
jgi:hypothetical protein